MKKIIIPNSNITDPKHKELIIEKQRLQKQESLGQISEEELKYELNEIDARIQFNVKEYIESLKEKRIVKKEQNMEERKKMEVEKIKKEVVAKPVKVKKTTNTDIIIELLQRKSLKTVADVVAKFKEKVPSAVEKNVIQQVREIIGWVKKGYKKYAKYTWNEEDFLLIPKE